MQLPPGTRLSGNWLVPATRMHEIDDASDEARLVRDYSTGTRRRREGIIRAGPTVVLQALTHYGLPSTCFITPEARMSAASALPHARQMAHPLTS